MPSMDLDSDSSLSEAPEEEVKKLAPIFMKAKKATKLVAPPPVVSPPRPKRPPSPPHEEVLADNPDIAFIVMFRSRFQEAFSSKLAQFGPQDIERGVVDSVPSPEIQSLLCALLALVLNRKKPIERGHYGRAVEEAISTHKSQWPLKWNGQNPLPGTKDFSSLTPSERLNFLRTLVIWALGSSEVISEIIKNKYKQTRHNDDENQPLSVQPWGLDGDKRRYFLVQGLDDTNFRVYREGSRYTKNAHWYSVAGDIDEVKALAEKLEKVDGTQAARRLSGKIHNAIPTFEATEEKRRRREYRQQRRAAFTRPEPGFGIYEGRTRGKRMRYTYEEADEGSDSDATSTRRSTRNQSGRSTPFETGPTYTASGRQSRQPRTGGYGESLLSNNVMYADDEDHEDGDDRASRAGSDETDPVRSGARATRSGGARPATNGRKRKHIEGYNSIDGMSDEDEASASGDGWDSEQNGDDEDEHMVDADDEEDGAASAASDLDEDDDSGLGSSKSLLVKLKVADRPDVPAKDTPPTSPPAADNTPGRHGSNDERATTANGTTSATSEPTTAGAALANGPPSSNGMTGAPHGKAAELSTEIVKKEDPAPVPASTDEHKVNGFTTASELNIAHVQSQPEEL